MKITFQGKEIQLIGEPKNVSEKIGDFYVINAEGQKVMSDQLFDKLTLISVVPNINTSVCSIQTKKFNQKMDEYPNVNFYTISTNTIEDQKKWCAAEDVTQMQLVSDIDESFGRASNLLVPDMGILARSVWILNENGEIVYRQVVNEVVDEPDYDAALAKLDELSK